MSPRSFAVRVPDSVGSSVRTMWIALGLALREARRSRRWAVAELARRAGVSPVVVYRLESGQTASTVAAARVAHALGLRVEFVLSDPRKHGRLKPDLSSDPVHSAMGEFETRRLRGWSFGVGMDEPYQHFQFAGRADVVAWDLDTAALLHIENRTRFPDFQEMAGSYNAKRSYLGKSLARRFQIRGWAAETHVIAAMWTSEVLHTLRLRTESFRSVCADSPDSFAGWWNGQPPPTGRTSALVLIDPLAAGRQAPFIGLEQALTARPRHHGYADVAARLAGAE